MKPLPKWIASAALVLALASSAQAENARLPYAALYHMEKIQQDLSRNYTNLIVVLRMIPTNAAVKPNEVEAYLDSKSGKIPVKIAPGGDFSVPLRDDLVTEETWLITNQPRGSMQLNWGLNLAVDAVANPTSYRRLMKTIQDCSYVEDRMREVLPSASRVNITGLKIIFPASAENPSAVIHAKSGDEKISANADHALVIPMKSTWLEEDPQVTFSTTPDRQELAGD
jgi:hypothetical protein